MRFRWMTYAAAALVALAMTPALAWSAEPDPALRAYHAGNGFLNRGLNELAIKEYEAFLEQRPDHDNASTARYGLGVALFRLSRYEDCVDALTPVLQEREFEFASEADLLLGQSHLMLGEFSEAAERFQSLVDRDASHASASAAAALLVESRYRAGDTERAERAADAFTRRWPNDAQRDRVMFFGAMAAMADERFSDAAARFSTVVESAPESPLAGQATLLAAQCHQRAGALNEAARWYRQIIDEAQDALLPDALYGLGAILHAEGQDDAAAELLDAFIRSSSDDPRVADAALRRAQIWFRQGRYDRASTLLDRAADAENADEGAIAYWQAKIALRTGDAGEAAAILANAIDAEPNHALAPEMQYDLSVALQRAGAHEQALESLTAFQQRFNEHELQSGSLALQASLAHELEDFDTCIAACEAFLESNSQSAQAPAIRFLLAETLFLSDDFEASEGAFEDYLDDHADLPDATRARFRLGVIAYQAGDFDRAAPHLERVLEESDNNSAFPSVTLMLGEIAFADRNWSLAEQRFEQYVRTDEGRDAPSASLKMGIARQRQSDFADALRAFDVAINASDASDETIAHAHFEQGQCLLAMERIDEAEQAFLVVVESDDATQFRGAALNHLGALAARRGDHELAIDRLEAALREIDDESLRADALHRLGRSYASAGRAADAAEAFETLNNDHPDNRFALEAQARQALAMAKSGDDDDAIRMIERLESNGLDQLDPALAGAVRYEKAWRLREQGDVQGAADAYQALLTGDISDDLRAHALVELADLELAEGQFDDAIGRLREAMELAGPGGSDDETLRAGATYRLGLALHRTNAHAEAAEWLDQYLRSGHVDDALVAPSHLMAGESLYQVGRHRQATPHFEQVVEISDDDDHIATSLLRLGECQAAGQKWAASERAFSDYLSRFHDGELWFQARFGQGWARENLGRHDDAISAYQEVVDRHDGKTAARAQFQIGECLFAQRKLQDAVAAFMKVDVLYAYPEWSAAALYEAGRCFEALGQPAEARTQFQRIQDEYADTKWAPMAASRLAAVPANTLPGR